MCGVVGVRSPSSRPERRFYRRGAERSVFLSGSRVARITHTSQRARCMGHPVLWSFLEGEAEDEAGADVEDAVACVGAGAVVSEGAATDFDDAPVEAREEGEIHAAVDLVLEGVGEGDSASVVETGDACGGLDVGLDRKDGRF